MQSVEAFASAGLDPRRLLELLQEGWAPDRIMDMVGRFAQDEGHAEGGRAEHDPYADFHESENIEDRRAWTPEECLGDGILGPTGIPTTLTGPLVASSQSLRQCIAPDQRQSIISKCPIGAIR